MQYGIFISNHIEVYVYAAFKLEIVKSSLFLTNDCVSPICTSSCRVCMLIIAHLTSNPLCWGFKIKKQNHSSVLILLVLQSLEGISTQWSFHNYKHWYLVDSLSDLLCQHFGFYTWYKSQSIHILLCQYEFYEHLLKSEVSQYW